MKQQAKSLLGKIGNSRTMRRIVEHLFFPAVAACLRDEIRTGRKSRSGLIEQLSWKMHSSLVLREELAPTGEDCSADHMRSDNETRKRLIDAIMPVASRVEGDILEFGVYRGESLELLAQGSPDRQAYGFDSFEGLPQDWWRKPKGTFKTELPKIESHNISLVQGLFSDTLPGFLGRWSNKACLVHVDCVLYQSTMDCLLPVLSRCQKGTVILFDEYHNYESFAEHEWLAWREIRAEYGVRAHCIAYDGKRAAFEITDLGAFAPEKGRKGATRPALAPTAGS